jgi:hypothetical protein
VTADIAWARVVDCYIKVATELQRVLSDCPGLLRDAVLNGHVQAGYENHAISIQDLKDRGLVEHLPEEDVWYFDEFRVQVSRASLLRWLSEQRPQIISGEKRGPKASYDWDKAWAFICGSVHREGRPATQAEMIQKVRDWFGKLNQYPADSEVKKRVRLLWTELDDN